jgi:hypothetical protein
LSLTTGLSRDQRGRWHDELRNRAAIQRRPPRPKNTTQSDTRRRQYDVSSEVGVGRHEANYIYYSAADVHVRQLLTEALFHADHTDLDRDLPENPEAAHHATTGPA